MKDDWNKFVKDNSDKSKEWWRNLYQCELSKRGGLTAREWDHYDKIEREIQNENRSKTAR